MEPVHHLNSDTYQFGEPGEIDVGKWARGFSQQDLVGGDVTHLTIRTKFLFKNP